MVFIFLKAVFLLTVFSITTEYLMLEVHYNSKVQ